MGYVMRMNMYRPVQYSTVQYSTVQYITTVIIDTNGHGHRSQVTVTVTGHRSQVTGQRSRPQVTGHGHSGQKCINKSCGGRSPTKYSCQEQWTGNKKKSITFFIKRMRLMIRLQNKREPTFMGPLH